MIQPFTKPVDELRKATYNATVAAIHRVHDELMILRVRPDLPEYPFEAGQYVVLGLGYWEPRVADAQAEDPNTINYEALIKRAYSVSCRMLDAEQRLSTVAEDDDLEFYIFLVRQAETPPALTPRLFCLQSGDRLYLGPRPHGHYCLDRVGPEDNVLFVGTGTGEAPHNAMIAELLRRGHPGKIACITCVRRKADLAYEAKHRYLEQNYPNYRYVPLTTREPENLDDTRPDYVGKRYVQDVLREAGVAEELGFALDPQRTQVYLCGNPAMIGVPLRTRDQTKRYPTPLGMVEVLENQGFHIDQPHHPGNIHFEKYW